MDEFVRTCDTAVGTVKSWIEGMSFKLADRKTAVLFVSSRKRIEFFILMVGDQHITSKQAIMYLGVVLRIDLRLGNT